MTLEPSDAAAARPLLRVVRGDATPEELAALVAVLTARQAAPADAVAPARSLWARPQLRRAMEPGPGAWRASAFRL